MTFYKTPSFLSKEGFYLNCGYNNYYNYNKYNSYINNNNNNSNEYTEYNINTFANIHININFLHFNSI